MDSLACHRFSETELIRHESRVAIIGRSMLDWCHESCERGRPEWTDLMSEGTRFTDGRLLLWATGMIIWALTLENITVVPREAYRGVLLSALAFTVAADVCLVVVVRRGRTWQRIVAIVLMLPTLFVIADFLRRAPYVFE